MFNLDYWMFDRNFDKPWSTRFYEAPLTHWDGLKVVLKQLSTDPLDVFRRLPAIGGNLLGLEAIMQGAGFQHDGTLPGSLLSDDVSRIRNDGIRIGQLPVLVSDRMAQSQIGASHDCRARSCLHLLLCRRP